jgi:periplasmic divalent cation tolerance protein
MSAVNTLLVLITAPSADEGARLGRALVEERLAACVNIVPGLRSIYRWEGEMQDDAEALLIVKSSPALFEALEARVRELHPYEVPEVLAIPVAAGSAPYLRWLHGEIRD